VVALEKGGKDKRSLAIGIDLALDGYETRHFATWYK